jgi:hypothetical protein
MRRNPVKRNSSTMKHFCVSKNPRAVSPETSCTCGKAGAAPVKKDPQQMTVESQRTSIPPCTEEDE